MVGREKSGGYRGIRVEKKMIGREDEKRCRSRPEVYARDTGVFWPGQDSP